LYIAQIVVDAYAFGTGERIQLLSGSLLKPWTLAQMRKSGFDKPVEEVKKESYDLLCARRTWTANMNKKFTFEQNVELTRDARNIFKYCKRVDIPNADLFSVIGGNWTGSIVWASKNDLVKK
jgi:hypothetical protein